MQTDTATKASVNVQNSISHSGNIVLVKDGGTLTVDTMGNTALSNYTYIEDGGKMFVKGVCTFDSVPPRIDGTLIINGICTTSTLDASSTGTITVNGSLIADQIDLPVTLAGSLTVDVVTADVDIVSRSASITTDAGTISGRISKGHTCLN